jgi:hypothetical protein
MPEYSDETFKAALAQVSKIRPYRQCAAAAKIIGCSSDTVRRFLKRNSREAKKRWSRRTAMRLQHSHPNEVEIELALYRTGVKLRESSRILGCSWSLVCAYVQRERAKGREIGRRGAGCRSSGFKSEQGQRARDTRESIIEIAIEISDEEIAAAGPLRDMKDDPLLALLIAHMGDEL